MRKVFWALAATLAAMTVAHAQSAYITDQLRVALRAEPEFDAEPIATLSSGTALAVLARDARMVQVRTENAEGWVDARYVVTEPPATAQLIATRAQLEQVRIQLNQAQGALAEQMARAAGLQAKQVVRPESPRPALALLLVSGISAAAMLGIGFFAGMARVRRNYRKRLGGMTLGI